MLVTSLELVESRWSSDSMANDKIAGENTNASMLDNIAF
jgi:hypothetical protein